MHQLTTVNQWMKPIFTTNNNKKKKKLTYTGTQTEMQRETQTQTYTQTERQHIHTHRRAYMTDLRLLGPAGGVCPCRRLNVVFSCGDGSAARISCRRPPAPQQHSVHTPWQQHLVTTLKNSALCNCYEFTTPSHSYTYVLILSLSVFPWNGQNCFRSLSYAKPSIWNTLPCGIRSSNPSHPSNHL